MVSRSLVLLFYKSIYKNLVKNMYTGFFSNFLKIIILETEVGSHRRLSK